MLLKISVYVSQWILFQDFVLTSRNFVRSCTAVRIEWLCELAPHYFDLESWPEGDTKSELEKAYRRLMQDMEFRANRAATATNAPSMLGSAIQT